MRVLMLILPLGFVLIWSLAWYLAGPSSDHDFTIRIGEYYYGIVEPVNHPGKTNVDYGVGIYTLPIPFSAFAILPSIAVLVVALAGGAWWTLSRRTRVQA